MKPEELHNIEEYKLIAEVDYKGILDFVAACLKPVSTVLWIFYIFTSITVINLVYITFSIVQKTGMDIFELIGKGILWLLIFMIPIIPLHELLHGLAFKLMGAKKLTFGANFKEMVFYVTADMFVLNKKKFYILALTPFIIFSCFFIFMILQKAPFIQGLGALLLVFHTSCCIGDFALMSFFSMQSKNGDIFTFDNTKTHTSYFFQKINHRH